MSDPGGRADVPVAELPTVAVHPLNAATARLPRVGFFARVAAAVLDGIILIPLISVYGVAYDRLLVSGRMSDAAAYLMQVLAALFLVLYTSFEVLLAATPGKLILGQRIARADGAAADTWTLANRWLYKNGNVMFGLISAITTMPLADWLGSIWLAVIVFGCFFVSQESRQAFHDRWARTAVYWKGAVIRRGFEP